jgi:hypothetical protein
MPAPLKTAGSALFLAVACSTIAQVTTPLPQGTAFPLMMYEVSAANAPSLTPYGWNILQDYGLDTTNNISDYLGDLLTNRVTGVAEIPATGTNHPYVEWPQSQVQALTQGLAANANLVWWSLPEEMQPGLTSELQILSNYTAWTRAYDPMQRPTYEYTPNGWGASTISQIVSNVDVIGLGCYCEYIGMPHAWVRYVVQNGLNSIALAGKTVGNDYLAGQKTPVAVLYCARLSDGNTNPPTMPTPAQTYHDFWSAIASGARGIAVFAYNRALQDDPSLVTNLQQLNLAASQLTGPEKLGYVILYGTQNAVTFAITSGPTQTVAFQPPSEPTPLQFPSLNVLSKTWSDTVFVLAVNSTDQAFTAVISNVPSFAASAALPFESRSVVVTNGSFTDSFPPWGVHIYKLADSIPLGSFVLMPGGGARLVVTNSGVSSFTVLASTDLKTWTAIGQATSVSSGVYQFVDTNRPNGSFGYYRLRWP